MYHARYEKPLKNHSLFVAKKNVETYSPSNAVALDLEEEVLLKHPSKTKTRKKKELNRRRLTDVE